MNRNQRTNLPAGPTRRWLVTVEVEWTDSEEREMEIRAADRDEAELIAVTRALKECRGEDPEAEAISVRCIEPEHDDDGEPLDDPIVGEDVRMARLGAASLPGLFPPRVAAAAQ